MRKAPRCFPKPLQYLSKCPTRTHAYQCRLGSSKSALRPLTGRSAIRRSPNGCSNVALAGRQFATSSRWPDQTDASAVIAPSGEHHPQARNPSRADNIHAPMVSDDTNPRSWAARFDEYLPQKLRLNLKQTVSGKDHITHTVSDIDLSKIEHVVRGARQKAKVDIWEWMLLNHYYKPAVWLMNAVLRNISASRGSSTLDHPSNIVWPFNFFETIERSPLAVQLTFEPSATIDYDSAFDKDEFFRPAARSQHYLMNAIWTTLGKSVAGTTNPTHTDGQEAMAAVLLVLGEIHNMGMMPNDIYSHQTPDRSAFIKRPPILHLVSSRILTSLSDAVWRNQQDEAIAHAVEMGRTFKEISQDVPGGRFRLKVRPLGPEIWLEFILWCCIEGGHTRAAVSIVKAIQQQTDSPWFAIRWCSAEQNDQLNVRIDWDRMKLRHGGTVGLIEGYSREKPFVDVPSRTISVEVVLGLIESCINSCHPGGEGIASGQNFYQLRDTERDIRDVLTFLEPHDLTGGYLDYLETRLIQLGVFDVIHKPAELQIWTSHMDFIRSLQSANPATGSPQGLQLDSVKQQSLSHVGIKHQAMDTLLQLGDIHGALAIFNDIQELVDQSKVKSISDFLQMQPDPNQGFFSSRAYKHRLEFADSHGQLPLYKLAGFLNLISETHLTGLGQWLLFSDDIDGALIPPSAYKQPSMLAAICKFAAASQDESLLDRALSVSSTSTMKSTVRVLRSTVNAELSFLNVQSARQSLVRLKTAQAGGPGIANIANLASVILKLENDKTGDVASRSLDLHQSRVLLEDVLGGEFDSPRLHLSRVVRLARKQQVSHMLRIFARFEGSVLQEIARKNAVKFHSGNTTSLAAKDFNILLAAVVEVGGSSAGQQLWQCFCKDTQSKRAFNVDDVDYDTGGDIFHFPLQGAVQQFQGELDFKSPFFPQIPTNEEEQPAPKPTLQDYLLLTRPVTLPNLQTLRIIVRAAVAEKQALFAETGVKNPGVQRRILKWSLDRFKAFGIESFSTLNQEIEEPISNLDIDVDEHIDKPAAQPVSIRYIDGQISERILQQHENIEHFEVSPLWAPIARS